MLSTAIAAAGNTTRPLPKHPAATLTLSSITLPVPQSGRYAGKYMGLDYTLVSQKLWEAGAVTLSEVVGASAAECHGSDHAPILAKFDWSKVEAV